MRWFHTVLLAVPVLVVGCLPTTPAEAGVGVVLLGFACVLPGLALISQWYQVQEGKKWSARFFVGASLLIGGGVIALGARLAGWWGQ